MDMERRTTVVLDDDVYKALVKESLERYKTAKSISKVLNEIVKHSLANRSGLTKLLKAKKLRHITAKEFEEFRRELSKSVES